jgi:hypothetical protein
MTYVPGLFFSGFFDDAAIFPPGDAPLSAAVPAHRALRSRLGALVGPFVAPASRLGDFFRYAGEGAPVDVALIADPADLPAAAARVEAHPLVRLAAVEIPVVADARAALDAVRALADLTDLPAAVEVPRTPARYDVLDVLAGTRYRAKLRTGGPHGEAFPSPRELATTLHACVERGVALKCTAGLHRAVRHIDPKTGFDHHGFLNVLVAAAELADGASVATVAGCLRDDYGPGLAAAVRSWTPERGARARAVFTSFGTCSVAEPVADLIALGLLPETDRIAV